MEEPNLRILHVFRAPVGGLFRHVLDLAAAQAHRGHAVGLLADSTTGGERAEAALGQIAPLLELGIARVPMSRAPGIGDIQAAAKVSAHAQAVRADVVHGHGAKGGLYGRLARVRAAKAYTPHGGSLNFSKRTPEGFIYLACESLLRFRTDIFLFESAYAERAFRDKVGRPRGTVRVVHNGISDDEFVPVEPRADARNLIFIGELAERKGIDVLIDALARLDEQGHRMTLAIVGAGPEEEQLRNQAAPLGAAGLVTFFAPRPAREAFTLGRVLVVPSRAESLPYVVLEGLAAGMPILATNVGGMPEIFGAYSDTLLPPGDVPALVTALQTDPEVLARRVPRLRERVRERFSIDMMCDSVLEAYREALDSR